MAKGDAIQYPIDDLRTIAATQHKALNDTWQNHQTHLNQYILTPASTLPKDVADAFRSHMTSWHQTLQDHYDALHTLLNVLDTGATNMEQQDKDVSKEFQGF